jgi:uncharacterized repeat protein (TIGR01451 family)
MRYSVLATTAAALLTGAALSVAALAASPLSITTSIEKEVVTTDASGKRKTTRVAADKIVPGETVIYTYQLKNAGGEPAAPVVIATPIPPNMVYENKSATTAGATVNFSIDRGQSFAEPAKLRVVDATGKKRPATAADYTNIRWQLTAPLKGDAPKEIAFRAVLK